MSGEPAPPVSIVTPAFDAERFVAGTIASVQAQSFSDWELLVVDDGSRDRTAEIVGALAAADPRIRLLRQEKNGGPARARNRALAQARGRYVAFLDSDDLWLPLKLERQLDLMGRSGCAVCFTAYRRMSADGARTGRVIPVPGRLAYRQLLANTAIAMLTAVVDRRQAGDFRMTDAGYDDYILWLSLLRRGLTACGLNEDLARYRVVGGSVSSRPLRSAGWVWRIYREREKLPLPAASWYLANYGLRALLKRRGL